MRLSYTVNTLVTKQTIGIFKIHDGKNLFMVLNYNKDEVHHLFCFFSMSTSVFRFTSWFACNSSCFKELLHKLTVKLQHHQERPLNTFFSLIFPFTGYKSFNYLFFFFSFFSHFFRIFRCFGLSVQGLQDSCSIHLSLLLNVISPTLPASQLPAAKKPPLQTWGHYAPCLVASSSWCVKTRMPLSLSVQLHSHIHKHKHYLPV